MQGHVTNLETIVNPKNGCIAGTVHVDTGYLTLDKPGVDGKGIVNMKDEKVPIFLV